MTKEEIRKKHFDRILATPSIEKLDAMMDEYAKQEAIGFAEWLQDNYTEIESKELQKKAWVNYKENTVLITGSDWHYTTLINECGKTTEQLYNLYKQQTNV